MSKLYGSCELCNQKFNEEYLNGRTPTEAINDHLEQDHADVLHDIETGIDKNSDTTALELAWDLHIKVTRAFQQAL